tara:strand:+ start:4833 stop:5249 length:417 start_codon:yes stop_codon:yes gene_type:complete
MSVSKTILLGRLGADPELKYTPSSLAVTTIKLATNQKTKKGEETEWHTVVFFGKQAETVNQYMQKGRQIYVEGKNKTKTWEKDGEKRSKTEIIADTFQFIGSRANSGVQASGAAKSVAKTDNYKVSADIQNTFDDIPF